MFSYRCNHFMMKYTIVILLLIAQIWVSTPLFADQEKVQKIIALLEDHMHCGSIIGLAAQKDYRLQLQYEVDYDLYSSKNIEKAINASIASFAPQVTQLAEAISSDGMAYIEVKMNELERQSAAAVKDLFNKKTAKGFDPYYRECLKKYGID